MIGHCSAACSILPTLKAPPQSMPTVIGPSEPPIMVVMPELMACSQSWAESKCTCTSMPPGVAIMPFGIAHRGGRADDQVRMHAVHRRGVAGFADADDLAVLDADIALDDAEHRIDHQRIAQQHVERAHGAVIAGRYARGHRAASCRRHAGTLRQARRSHARPRRAARCRRGGSHRPRRAIHMRVVFAAHLGHGLMLP